MKKIAIILFLGFVYFIPQYYKRYKSSELQGIIPLPYKLNYKINTDSNDYAPVVIIGDKFAYPLGLMASELSKSISQGLSRPVKVHSLAQKGAGLHRSLYELQSLSKTPLVVIYLGGGEEFYESRFYMSEKNLIQENLDLYKNTKIQSLLSIVPKLAPLVYTPFKLMSLEQKIQRGESFYNDEEVMIRNALVFELYQIELGKLIEYIKDVNSYLITINSPINLANPPGKSCQLTIDEYGKNELSKIKQAIGHKDYKNAYSLAKELVQIYPSHAGVHYALALAAKWVGKKDISYRSFVAANAYDCNPVSGPIIFNKILEKVSTENSISFYNFHSMVLSHFPEQGLFYDGVIPAPLYYQKLVSVLSARIKKILKL